eukprot:TRINITY_DN26191_c0_g2_i1.p1 TRINITY_DN26191_c0_g2~~TRINITY_DN26191_c0_g2_i1.p1  ORF type:complete len:109 (+),score=35.70 TRINITY_DN26191_c0_g2_i1:117-443(+)
MIRRPPRSTQGVSSAASDVYKRQKVPNVEEKIIEWNKIYKADAEMMKAVQRLVSLLTEWKEFVKLHIAKNPLLTVTEYTKYEEIKKACLLYTSPSPRDLSTSRMPSSA